MRHLLLVCALATLPTPVLAFDREGVVVWCDAPGLTGFEVEKQVVAPIEQAVAGAPGLERTLGIAYAGCAELLLLLAQGTDVAEFRSVVRDRLAAVKLPAGGVATMRDLPPSLDGIHLVSLKDDGSRSRLDLVRLNEDFVRPSIATVSGVQGVLAWGGGTRDRQVTVDAARLAAHGLTVCDVVAALQKTRPQDDLEDVTIAVREGTPVPLRDVATLSIVESTSAGELVWSDGRACLGDVVLLPNGAGAILDAIQGKLPAGVSLESFGPPDAHLRLVTQTCQGPGATAETLRKAREACASVAGVEAVGLCRSFAEGGTIFPDGDGHLLLRCSKDVPGRVGQVMARLAQILPSEVYVEAIRGVERSELTLQVFAEGFPAAEEFADKAARAIRETPGIQAMRRVQSVMGMMTKLKLDEARLKAAGVETAKAQMVYEAARGAVALQGTEHIIVRVEGSTETMKELQVPTANGGTVGLWTLGRQEEDALPLRIVREGGVRFSGVRAWAGLDGSAALEAARKAVESLDRPSGMRLVWGADLGGM